MSRSVVGVSTLYHLAKKGLTDAVLVERKELTSGSTWHAAGLLPLFNMSYSVGQIHKYSVRLYGELERETGQNVGFKKCSNIRLARTKDRWDEFIMRRRGSFLDVRRHGGSRAGCGAARREAVIAGDWSCPRPSGFRSPPARP